MNREDFDILSTGIIYLDNAATTQKPRSVVSEIVDYYTKYTANAHRGDYDISLKVDEKYDGVREKVRDFINAETSKEIIFTKGSTESFNMIIFGFMANYLKKEDRVLLTKGEHASNILPWLTLSKKIGFTIDYIDLEDDYSVSIEKVKEKIYENTKVISIAHISNSIGDLRPVKEIGEICKRNNILFVLDATQSIGHLKVDVLDLNVDFLGFSAHKMLGPTGVGVLYGKLNLLEELVPIEYGGGMNISFNSDGEYELKSLPNRLEAGTRNIAGVIGLGAAIDYLESVGLDRIHEYEMNLKRYLVERLSTVPNIKIYNKSLDTGVLLFNINNYFSQDVAIYLNKFNICIRAGNHCAKMLQEAICDTNTCRISLYFYNTKEEIDILVNALMNQDKILDTVV
ncbi:MAG: cysteine desulfurase [Bacilli bacterium]|nr:cysteine desulfurase [Bacilli bacterium]